MKKIKDIQVLIDEDIKLPFYFEKIIKGKYVRVDIDGKKRNLLYISNWDEKK